MFLAINAMRNLRDQLTQTINLKQRPGGGGGIKRDSALFFTQLWPKTGGGKIEKLLSREISWADLFL